MKILTKIKNWELEKVSFMLSALDYEIKDFTTIDFGNDYILAVNEETKEATFMDIDNAEKIAKYGNAGFEWNKNDILSKLGYELVRIDNGKFYYKVIDRLLKQKKEYWKLVEKIQKLEDEIKKNEKEGE